MKVISAKSFYYLILYIAYFFIFYKFIFPYYNLAFKGNILLHLILSTAFTIVVILYTIILASFFKTTIGWTEVLAFSTYPLFLVSGYSWPLDALPYFLKGFANILPSTPYFKIFSMLSVEGAHLNNIKTGIFHLLILLIIGYTVLYIRYKFMQHKKLKLN
jgi:ABC-2 type transport system permease protein